MTIRKAQKTDIPQILLLLSELNQKVSPERWRPFFTFGVGKEEVDFGHVLEVDDEIQGFLGTVYSRRKYNNCFFDCCNIHGWIVREKYKHYSLKLMTEVLKQDMVFTCFSAMELTQVVLKRLKFFYIHHAFRIFRPYPFISITKISVSLLNNPEAILASEEKELFKVHRKFGSVFVLLKKEGKTCLLIFKPETYFPAWLKIFSLFIPEKKRRLLKLEYIGDQDFFSEHFKSIAFKLMRKGDCLGFIVSNKMVERAGLVLTKKYFGQRPYMYRYNKDSFGEEFPDTLYSEMFVLNHKG